MRGEPGCFGWDGMRCSALWGECQGRERCHFYKPVDRLEKERLKIYETSHRRYERYDKKYWLMAVSDEFISDNEDELALIRRMRVLARRVANGDAKAAEEARAILEGPT